MKQQRSLFVLTLMGLALLWLFFANMERPMAITMQDLPVNIKSVNVRSVPRNDSSSVPLQHCILPKADPFDRALKSHIDLKNHKNNRKSCNQDFEIITSFKDGRVKVSDSSLHCWGRCFRAGEVYHGKNVEDKWSPIKDTLYNCSFVEVTCSKTDDINRVDYTMLHAQFIPMKNSTKPPSTQTTGKRHNVFVFLVDSVSTAAAERYLQRTLSFVEKSFKAVQFPYLNRVGLNSRPNALALFYGKSVEPVDRAAMGRATEPSDWDWYEACNRYLDNETSIFDDYKDYGYTTLLTDDWWEPIFNYPDCKGLKKSIVDHTLDPFIMQSWKNSQKKNFDGRNCHFVHQDSLEYTKRFMEAYSDQPLFTWNFMTRITHDSQSGGLILDDDLVQYLFENKEMFDDSFLIFMSDHGCRACSITTTEAGRFEFNNPFFTMSVPKTLRTPETLGILKENSGKLQTHYDIRATLLDIVKYQPQKNYEDRDILVLGGEKGQSFLRKQDGERSCMSLPIPFTYCICQYPMEALNPNSTEVVEAGKAVIQEANKQLNESGLVEKCNLWKFSHVESSDAFAPAKETGSMKIVVAASWPYAKARFVTTVYRSPSGTFTVGTIDRVDRYLNRGSCFRGPLEALCDCKKQ